MQLLRDVAPMPVALQALNCRTTQCIRGMPPSGHQARQTFKGSLRVQESVTIVSDFWTSPMHSLAAGQRMNAPASRLKKSCRGGKNQMPIRSIQAG